ncbi:hypothetical protein Pint_32756 [Pistacia integerrima]|uniref:Uncharacterized protein n=1 Tax=Pistacia integerrima TaxID=434235 RepID=A0ACC0XP67_9ROSI|nr:hypothetical protein Pint_32756 [Pistacia integerrima]
MAAALRSVYVWMIFSLSFIFLCSSQNENEFIYNNGFHEANLQLDEISIIHPNGLLQLTNTSERQAGHAFYPFPIKFNTSSPESLSFSTNFVFAIVPESVNIGGHGIAFVISPSMDFSQATETSYLGLFNPTNDGRFSNHILAVEVDTVESPEFYDIDGNHVGIDVNGLVSNETATATYYSNEEGNNKSLVLMSGDPIQVWIDYDGWSFNRSGQAQNLDVSKLPPVPAHGKATAYIVWKKKYEEVCEDWEREYGPQRFPYKNLYKSTKELIRTGKATTSTDVFAFGAFMLEVACGRRPIEQQGYGVVYLVEWVINCWKRGAIINASDPRLEGIYAEEQMELVLKLGLFCSHPNPAARPNMRQLMQYLDGDAKLPDISPNSSLIDVFINSNEASNSGMSFPSLFENSFLQKPCLLVIQSS